MKYAFNIEYSNDNIGSDLTLEYSLDKVTEDLEAVVVKSIDESMVIFEHKDILRDWFPKNDCHIFLSHSHKDKNLAVYIANKLYNNYGIKTFIDSEFWGYVDDAIKKINHEHNLIPPEDEYLHYGKCMRVASNFYLILSNALTDGIDASDSIWFLNSENALNACSSSDEEFSTFSPWIYTELNFSSKVKCRGHKDRVSNIYEDSAGMESISNITKQADVNVRYAAPNEHLINVSNDIMKDIMSNNIMKGMVNKDDVFSCLDIIYKKIRES
ncbi:hypothetical protein RJE46_14890 [Cedecea neteri]|uniref:hypothetical protein n=1 Tax=Cedecea neteri TaxID=158822 RepID=UPI0028929DE8|nr:hypothetical protein [Cedecea neteri]WNJ77919.1 hypothetical protein RJE46_14890 [Cedecea neteri]